MAFITVSDGTRLSYKHWGPKDAQPVMFHHGWPLSTDDWDNAEHDTEAGHDPISR